MEKKKKGKESWKIFEFIDYSGVVVATNNQAAEHLFGTANPEPLLLEYIGKVVSNPDFVFVEAEHPNYAYYYTKQIGEHDYVVTASNGCGVKNGELDLSRRAIHGFAEYKSDQRKKSVLLNPIKIIYHGLNFQCSS